jgi:hypothetical protein
MLSLPVRALRTPARHTSTRASAVTKRFVHVRLTKPTQIARAGGTLMADHTVSAAALKGGRESRTAVALFCMLETLGAMRGVLIRDNSPTIRRDVRCASESGATGLAVPRRGLAAKGDPVPHGRAGCRLNGGSASRWRATACRTHRTASRRSPGCRPVRVIAGGRHCCQQRAVASYGTLVFLRDGDRSNRDDAGQRAR